MIEKNEVDSGEKAMILLQSLICYLREKNVLSRADIEELRERVEGRIADAETHLPCASSLATAAASEMRQLEQFCGKKYGGKHRHRVNESRRFAGSRTPNLDGPCIFCNLACINCREFYPGLMPQDGRSMS